MRKSKLFTVVVSAFLLGATLVAVAPQAEPVAASPTVDVVKAANPGDFNPGLIIEDAKFFNGNAMSLADIQGFLNTQVRNCAAGYVCLKDYRETTRTIPATPMCATYPGGANESAAVIIFKVAQTCGISPQAILVTLQKEQGLVTKTAPSAGAYRAAMGAGCPDTAACDANYYGFFNQVHYGAYLFKRYTQPPGTGPGTPYETRYDQRFPVGQVVPVRYHPNVACGSASIRIHNMATHSLYIYTPYQPNAAALANLYGTGDGCSAYGNRNFWRIYTDWFGPTGSIGVLRIEQAYAAAGGASGPLGAATTDFVTITANGGGLVQGYENGAIAWSQPRGAFVLTGDIRTKFNALGGIGGPLGWPASPANSYTANGGGTVQAFQGAVILSSPSGTFSIAGSVRTYFNSAGSFSGVLGWPTGDQTVGPGGALIQPFQGGTVYWSGSKGGRSVRSQFLPLYEASGGLAGSLGWPAADAATIPANGGGLVQAFDAGALAWSASGGAHALTGAIRTYFNSVGGIGGVLGWPTGDQVTDPAGVISQTFQGGTVYWSAAKGGRFVRTELLAAFTAAGGLGGALGWPTGNSVAIASNGGGLVQAFDGGALAWTASGGAHALTGSIRTYFNSVGGIGGVLGWPTGDQVVGPGGALIQAFQGGTVYWSAAKGGRYVRSELLPAYDAAGGLGGALGWPTGNSVAIASNGGGLVQAFDGGALAWSRSGGAHALTGSIRTYFNSVGGIGGALGWPTGDQVTGAGGVLTQTFQGGTIEWRPGTGGRII